MIRKQLCGSIIRFQSKKATHSSTPNTCINRKIRTSHLLLNNHFDQERLLLIHDIRELPFSDECNPRDLIQPVIKQHIDHLWLSMLQEYITLSTFTFFSDAFALDSAAPVTKAIIPRIPTNLTDEFAQLIANTIINCHNQKEALEEALEATITDISEGYDALKKKITQAFRSAKTHTLDTLHTQRINAALEWYSINGLTQYTYICNSSDDTCGICLSLNGKQFDIESATSGVNLPPMHPNCNCTIQPNPELPENINILEVLGSAAIDKLKEEVHTAISNSLKKIESKLDLPLNTLNSIWSYLANKAIDDYCGAYTTITLDAKEYRIRLDSFSAVSIGPNGEFIKPENLLKFDAEMLELMKQRDSLRENSADWQKIVNRIAEINLLADEETLSVKSTKPYSFYVIGGDSTEPLYKYMQQAEVTYADMHKKSWIENLADSYQLVRNSGEMDLKNQPEWQHSAFIFDGEIIDQDVLGNINYGYFGKHCNFPDIVLFGAAGFAQYMSGNAEIEHWYSFFDDPRDNERVSQGMEIYNGIH